MKFPCQQFWISERTGSRPCLLVMLGEVNGKAVCLYKKLDASCLTGCTDVDALRFTAGLLNYCCITASEHRGRNGFGFKVRFYTFGK